MHTEQLPPKRLERLQWTGLSILFACLYMGHLWGARLKMDGQTYAALARHVLATGDWTTLHYSPMAYPDFYYHPPLLIWIQALVFRLVGASEVTARILPTFLAFLTVIGVYLFARRIGSRFAAFFAALVLILSSRYIKYASDFYLDGPLGAFMVWSSYAYLRFVQDRTRSAWAWAAASGVALGLGFMAKGPVVAAVPAGVLSVATLIALRAPARALRLLGGLAAMLLAAFLPLLLWIAVADGAHFLQQYFAKQVSRGFSSSSGLFRPYAILSLLKTYLPWVPFYFYGIYAILRDVFRGRADAGIMLPGAISFIMVAAFSVVAVWGEYYLVPFYPFAAIVVSFTVAPMLERFESRVSRGLYVISIAVAVVLATLPLSIHGADQGSMTRLLRRAVEFCDTGGVRRAVVVAGSADFWGALAAVSWITPWDAYVLAPGQIEPRQDTLVFLKTGQPLPAGYRIVPELAEPGVRLAEPDGARVCSLERQG